MQPLLLRERPIADPMCLFQVTFGPLSWQRLGLAVGWRLPYPVQPVLPVPAPCHASLPSPCSRKAGKLDDISLAAKVLNPKGFF